MKYLDEQQLLSDFLKGKEEAFEFVFSKYYKRMCLFASSFVEDSRESEDIAGEGFVRVWEGSRKYESLTHLKSSLYQTIRRLGINEQIARKRRHLRVGTYLDQQHKVEPSHLQEIVLVEAMAELHHAIESLPPKAQEIIKLSYLEGMSNSEIAQQMNISIQTVKNQKLRALSLLRTRVDKNSFNLLILGFFILEKI